MPPIASGAGEGNSGIERVRNRVNKGLSDFGQVFAKTQYFLYYRNIKYSVEELDSLRNRNFKTDCKWST